MHAVAHHYYTCTYSCANACASSLLTDKLFKIESEFAREAGSTPPARRTVNIAIDDIILEDFMGKVGPCRGSEKVWLAQAAVPCSLGFPFVC